MKTFFALLICSLMIYANVDTNQSEVLLPDAKIYIDSALVFYGHIQKNEAKEAIGLMDNDLKIVMTEEITSLFSNRMNNRYGNFREFSSIVADTVDESISVELFVVADSANYIFQIVYMPWIGKVNGFHIVPLQND